MFQDLLDELSRLWSWQWPVTQGQVVLVEIERFRAVYSNFDTLRLSIVYEFWLSGDGPYGGEGFWNPAFSLGSMKRLQEAKRKLSVGTNVAIRYRPDDPSINKLDRSVWKTL